MDAAGKALLRSRMREAAQKREKRIDSPLVRYNELGQPVCKVCNIAVKSESLWPAHLVSHQHKKAVDELKAQAKGAGANSTKGNHSEVVEANKAKTRLSSSLPDGFFDTKPKRVASDDLIEHDQLNPASAVEKVTSEIVENTAANLSNIASFSSNTSGKTIKVLEPSKQVVGKIEVDAPGPVSFSQSAEEDSVHVKVLNSSLPEGFFDNVDADHRARGLEPPKHDIQDEWKEFQKSIRDDLQEVDLRFEEEEFDAAEDREKLEILEQRVLLDRIEKLRQKQQEKAEETAISEVITRVLGRKPFVNVNLDMKEGSSSDGDSEEENLPVDWRAKQF